MKEPVRILTERERRRQEEALKGLTLRQKRLVKNIGDKEKYPTLSAAARDAGYAPISCRGNIYEMIKSPKIKRALAMYYSVGDKGLADLGAANITDILTDNKSADSDRINASKLALQVGGKLKNVNINAEISAKVEISADMLAEMFLGERTQNVQNQ